MITEEDLQAWRAHPVTEMTLKALKNWLDAHKAAVEAAFMSGTSVTDPQKMEAERLAYWAKLALWDDLATGSAAGFMAALKDDDNADA
jgi:hypothetical protein